MFKKKTVAPPTTVSEAIAPFQQVKDNLLAVIEKHRTRAIEADRRIKDAKVYAEKVAEDENAVSAQSRAEMDQAAKIAESLAAILGEEPVAKSYSSDELERAKKINEARKNGTDSTEGLRTQPPADRI